MEAAANAVAETNRWVATLSLDEPDAGCRPWRVFMAASWLATAAGTVQPRRRTRPAEETTGA
jgi:hypothetical protein